MGDQKVTDRKTRSKVCESEGTDHSAFIWDSLRPSSPLHGHSTVILYPNCLVKIWF